MKLIRKQLVVAGLSAFLTLGMVNVASAALSLAEQADRTGDIVGSGLVNLGGLDILGKGNILARSIGIAVKAVVGSVDSPLASLIGQTSYNKVVKYKLGLRPRDTLDRVRAIWSLKEGVRMTITLDGGASFSCVVIEGGRALSCDEEPVSRS